MTSHQFYCSHSVDLHRRIVFLALCILIFQSAQSRAEPPPVPTAEVSQPVQATENAAAGALSSAADAEFYELLSQGLTHYDKQRYRDAIEELKQAYRIHPFPRILQNIGSAHRKLGEYREARQFLSMYLALEPSLASDKRHRIEEILIEVERKIAEQRQSSIPPTRPRWRLGVGIGVSLVGALVLGFGIPALAIDGRCIETPSLPGEVCAHQYDTRTLGIALTVSGGVLSLGGLLLASWPAPRTESGAPGRGLTAPRQSLLLLPGAGSALSVNW